MSRDGSLFVQDLVDWLVPTLQVASFLSKEPPAPDIFAIGFQELSAPSPWTDAHIRSQIEKHTPGNESYTLVAKAVNVGVALLVYARESEVAHRVCEVQTQWTGTGPAYMGNKGAVGIRFRVSDRGSNVGEVFTSRFYFPPLPSSPSSSPTTMYSTSHLFFLGDLNFRITIPPSCPPVQTSQPHGVLVMLKDDASREQLK
ncbi:hypothetical protein EDB19DRAFT_2041692 [Suillus lakei]|nr:hypothetical protein EDB19DRAFT_2041692 [Suillus lakei]